MLNKIRQLVDTAATAIDLAYKLSQGLDYKTLNKYILKINELKDVAAIVQEVSLCLKDILNYDLFALGIKEGTLLNIWIDPRVENSLLIERIKEDLNSQNNDVKVGGFGNEGSVCGQLIDAEGIASMLSSKFSSGEADCILYLAPGRKMLRYHNEIIEILTGAAGAAIERSMNIRQLEDAAFLDILTGCYNRRALNSYIDHDIADAQRYGRELSVIMFDIDHFKKINDTCGHQSGDIVLSAISGLIASSIRKSDYLARYGGEEFVLVLPNTSLSNASDLAERLRKKIEAASVRAGDRTLRVTASFGVAGMKASDSSASLLSEADSMLYRAKMNGRNSVVSDRSDCLQGIRFVGQAAVC